MAQQETRKQQIARRLRVSENVLEQYLQLKRAEVEDATGPASTDVPSAEAGAPAERRIDRSAERARREFGVKRIS